MSLAFSKLGLVEVLQATAVAGTAFTGLVRPYRGGVNASAPGQKAVVHLKTLDSMIANAITHLDCIAYRSGGTAHTLVAMRALNWTTLGATMAANATAITLAAGTGQGTGVGDPGLYSTNYNYPTPLSGTSTAAVADNAIAAGDYVALQLTDGTWHVSTIASGTFAGANLVLTTALPNVTGGGATSGTRVYFFGVSTDKDPATGQVHPQMTQTAAAALYKDWSNPSGDSGVLSALFPAQPILFYSGNGTNAGTLEFASGYFLNR